MSIKPQYLAGVPAMMMRGGTSKGLFFLAEDLPSNAEERDELLLSLMGSPDPRQIDGLGGGNPLTSKVAVVSRSTAPTGALAKDSGPDVPVDADLDYLFLQVSVDRGVVSDRQNCGNLVAGVAPFALERGLVPFSEVESVIRIRLLNTGAFATATVSTPNQTVCYNGDTAISGVPGTAAPIQLDFEDTMGSTCGALLPTGNPVDVIEGVEVTMVDNGMPTVLLRASDMGIEGTEAPSALNADSTLKARLEAIRLAAGLQMNLGDVAMTTIPKMTMVSEPLSGGDINTRTFIPHHCHDAIGVLGAVSVATALRIPGTIAYQVAKQGGDPTGPGARNQVDSDQRTLQRSPDISTIEHPTGTFDALVALDATSDDVVVRRSGIIRTARKLMDGFAFPHSVS